MDLSRQEFLLGWREGLPPSFSQSRGFCFRMLKRNLRIAIHVYLFLVLSIAVSCNNSQNDFQPQRSGKQQTGISHDLKEDEALGGHSLQRHVGKSDNELRKRLKAQPEIAAASTYTDLATANRVVSAALSQNSSRVEVWRSRPGKKPNLVLHYHGTEPIGRGVLQGACLAADWMRRDEVVSLEVATTG
jgi:hypothetical protein